jgi:hypothetical protein
MAVAHRATASNRAAHPLYSSKGLRFGTAAAAHISAIILKSYACPDARRTTLCDVDLLHCRIETSRA